ncbi:hypothetical protein IQ241_05760 [Romeria aff. gracilis LEGE 07310]|uniref:CBS domain-containing protein n=1 Tax=Vasconcelosia minhoensis LEGE 07310 TaxID=915328 RepID=A0A8J7DMJ6_9CYAN|nr:hypothetical protein [Romeria gracilis]MBE9076805.1 hypothetical protein [Romeria aff. gracilis LEGE 07310]
MRDMKIPDVRTTPDARTFLALFIPVIAILSALILSITIIVNDDEDTTASERGQIVFNATLPLFGTWVGTVLAYYFAKDNFEAASQSVRKSAELAQLTSQVSQGELQSTLVTVAMTAKSKMFFKYSTDTIALDEIVRQLERRGLRRLPILEDATAQTTRQTTSPDSSEEILAFPKGIIYIEDILKYLYFRSPKASESPTLQNFLQEVSKERPFALVGEEATLSTAKEAIDKIPDCNDAFVTKTGRQDSEVVGFLTNTDIGNYTKV